MDVSRGLKGRRVCGGIEIGLGALVLFGGIQTGDILTILSGSFIIVTGVLGAASHNMGTVIAYTVCGIICAILLLVYTILGVLVIVPNSWYYNLEGSEQAISIATVGIVAIVLIVAILE